MPDVPEGFTVQVLASGLNQPRVIRIAPNGDIFVAESGSGRVLVFAADSAGGGPATPEVFAENLEQPYGIVFHPPREPQHVYVAAANQVVRYPYSAGDRKATGRGRSRHRGYPHRAALDARPGGFPDGERLFVSIGSASNVADAMPEKSPEEVKAYEETHGLGAAWGDEENRAVVRVFDPEGTSRPQFRDRPAQLLRHGHAAGHRHLLVHG